MRISDWSSDVCSSDLREMELGYSFSMAIPRPPRLMHYKLDGRRSVPCDSLVEWSMWMAEGDRRVAGTWIDDVRIRSEEHTSELQSLMRISYSVFCLKKKKTETINHACTMLTTK